MANPVAIRGNPQKVMPGQFPPQTRILSPEEIPFEEVYPGELQSIPAESITEGSSIPTPRESLPTPYQEAGIEIEISPKQETVIQAPSIAPTFQPLPPAPSLPDDAEQFLNQAQMFLSTGKLPGAIDVYDQLIGKGLHLEDVIHDLRDALYHYPVDLLLWQLLGDAYLRSNRIQDAIDAYTQAEELIR